MADAVIPTCGICLQPLRGEVSAMNDKLCVLGCMHTFHHECMERAALAKDLPIHECRCPTCRFDPKAAIDVQSQDGNDVQVAF